MIDNTRLTGISDEGAPDIERQISLHQELGWGSLELRTVKGINACEMEDDEFDRVATAIEEAEFSTVAFGSSIANWSRSAQDPFERDMDDLLRAIPRMRRLKSRFIRIMSYISGGFEEEEWAGVVMERLGELTRVAAGEGVVLVLENCDGWASQSPENLSRLLNEIPDPALQVVFDPGNPLAHGLEPESVNRFFDAALERIVHFHIKDCFLNEKGEVIHCFPGEGQCENASLISRLESSGYSGMYSIEPHMTVQVHKSMEADSEAQSLNYSQYGQKAQALLASL